MGRTTHGMFKTPTWNSWSTMRSRCNNPNASNWQYYGGKGIAVCSQWDDFEVFLADMGERPEGTTLERLDSNGDYEPGNCRWATRKEQQRNRPGFNVLTEDTAAALRADYAADSSRGAYNRLAAKYDVSPSTARNVVTGRQWA